MSAFRRLGVSDIDVLALSVRDRESRRLIDEAITAYRGGALRSALVSTWIAVAYDIVAKARELSRLGEAAPRALVQSIDGAIAAKNKQSLQKIETELLSKANKDLQLLAPHEFEAFDRLQKDRHLCAHPAFVVKDELYQPSPELVRAHIVHALQYLLVHAPLQGKSAIDRFAADVLSPSFPITAEEIGVFVRTRYLDRAKDVLVINLLKAIFSAPFGANHAKYAHRLQILAIVLKEIAQAKTAIYDSVMPSYVPKKVEGISDVVLLNICPFVGSDPRIWNWIKGSDQTRIKRLLETADPETLKDMAAFDALDIAPLSEVLLDRFDEFSLPAKINFVFEHPRKEFVTWGLERYAKAGGFRYAELLGRSVVLPLSKYFTADDVKTVLEAANDNGQVWNASDTPEILEQLFDETIHLLSHTEPYWKEFVDARIEEMDGDASCHYAYPGLQERLRQNRSTPT